jgi:hypothetical protein
VVVFKTPGLLVCGGQGPVLLLLRALSSRMRRASWMSFGMMVTRFM